MPKIMVVEDEPSLVEALEYGLTAEAFEVVSTSDGDEALPLFIMRRVWGTDHIGDTKTIDVHVKGLRSRIEVHGDDPKLIVFVRVHQVPGWCAAPRTHSVADELRALYTRPCLSRRAVPAMKRYGQIAAVVGLPAVAVFLLLLPYSGHDSDPPECFSVLGYVVPCGLGPEQAHGAGFAFAGAMLAAVLVGIGWAVGRTHGAQGAAA